MTILPVAVEKHTGIIKDKRKHVTYEHKKNNYYLPVLMINLRKINHISFMKVEITTKKCFLLQCRKQHASTERRCVSEQ